MKRLRHRHLFQGKFLPIIISIFGVFFLITSLAPLLLENGVDGTYVLILYAVAIVVTIIIDYAITHHLTKEEKEKIKNARPPEWKKITKKIKKHFKEDIKALFMGTVFVIAGELVLSFIILIARGLDDMLVLIVVLVPVTITVFAIIGIQEHIWANMDDSAKYTIIKVDHCFYGEKTRGGIRRRFIVFYLPDGRYVLETNDNIPIHEIIVIKYKCFIRWEDAYKFTL